MNEKELYLSVLKPRSICKATSAKAFADTLTKEELESITRIQHIDDVVKKIEKASVKARFEPDPCIILFVRPETAPKENFFVLIFMSDKSLIGYDVNNSKKITFKSKIVDVQIKSKTKIQLLFESKLFLKFIALNDLEKLEPYFVDLYNKKEKPYYEYLFAFSSEINYPLQVFPDLRTILTPYIFSPSLDFILRCSLADPGQKLRYYLGYIVFSIAHSTGVFAYTFINVVRYVVINANMVDQIYFNNVFMHFFVQATMEAFGKVLREHAAKLSEYITPKADILTYAGLIIEYFSKNQYKPELAFCGSHFYNETKKKFGEEEALKFVSRVYVGYFVKFMFDAKKSQIPSDLQQFLRFEKESPKQGQLQEYKDVLRKIFGTIVEYPNRRSSSQNPAPAHRVMLKIFHLIGFTHMKLFDNYDKNVYNPIKVFVLELIDCAKSKLEHPETITVVKKEPQPEEPKSDEHKDESQEENHENDNKPENTENEQPSEEEKPANDENAGESILVPQEEKVEEKQKEEEEEDSGSGASV